MTISTPPEPRIFIIDDDAEMVRVLGDMLRMRQFIVREFVCTEALIIEIQSGVRCDLIVSDLRLGKRNGLELYEAVQAICKIPFLILSGDTHGFEENPSAQKVRMLMKPVTINVLITEIGSAIRRGAS